MIRIDGIYDTRKLVANAYKMSVAEGFGVLALQVNKATSRALSRIVCPFKQLARRPE